jgi:hypothetical protein
LRLAAERLSFRALIVTWIGVGLLLPFYGGEAFGLHAIGQRALAEHSADLVSVADDVRSGAGLVMFATGLGLLAIGAILAAVAVWRSSALPKLSCVLFALGFALYLPQFFGSRPIRIGHGLLVAAGCLWLAAAMWRRSASRCVEFVPGFVPVGSCPWVRGGQDLNRPFALSVVRADTRRGVRSAPPRWRGSARPNPRRPSVEPAPGGRAATVHVDSAR